jgi:hypothetical protein
MPDDYPIADFIEPTEYAWTEERYAARLAAKAYLELSVADYEPPPTPPRRPEETAERFRRVVDGAIDHLPK